MVVEIGGVVLLYLGLNETINKKQTRCDMEKIFKKGLIIVAVLMGISLVIGLYRDTTLLGTQDIQGKPDGGVDEARKARAVLSLPVRGISSFLRIRHLLSPTRMASRRWSVSRKRVKGSSRSLCKGKNSTYPGLTSRI
jgi:hypothetical protein